MSATYAVTGADELIAGSLVIEVEIFDTSVPPIGASAEATYQVFPLFGAVTPSVSAAGGEIVVGGEGLDGDPSDNVAVFKGIGLDNTASASFLTVDRLAHRGTVRVPHQAVTGPMTIRVNGRQAVQSLPFTVIPDMSACGYAKSFQSRPDGGAVILFDPYVRPGGVTPCPSLLYPNDPQGFPYGAIVRVEPDGAVIVMTQELHETVRIKHVAVTKSGVPIAVTEECHPPSSSCLDNPSSPPPELVITSPTGAFSIPTGALGDFYKTVASVDFDRSGNLYAEFSRVQLGSGSGTRILRVSAATNQIEIWPNDYWTIFPDYFLWPPSTGRQFVVSCDDYMYITVPLEGAPPNNVDVVIIKIDIQTRAIVAQTPRLVGFRPWHTALSCKTNELWGVNLLNYYDGTYDLWKLDVSGSGSLPTPTSLETGYGVRGFSIAADGRIPAIYEAGWPDPSGITSFVRLHTTISDPCPGIAPLGAVPECSASPLQILPSTTRWKPQRAIAEPMYVRFSGPLDLAVATVALAVTPPQGGPTNYVATFVNVQPSPGSPGEFVGEWRGPWSVGGVLLPAGNYTLRVSGERATDPTPLQSADYRAVSLVEVAEISFHAIPGGAPLDIDPSPAGGRRLYAESLEEPTNFFPFPPVADTVAIRVRVNPEIPDPGPQGAITVVVRAYDVDDPSEIEIPQIPPNSEAQPCPPMGCDNVPPVESFDVPQRGHFAGFNGWWVPGDVGLSVSITGDTGWATFRTSTLQGDNYRVAASTYETWLAGLSPVQPPVPPNNLGLMQHASGEEIAVGVQVTELLTVWRTLHLELDTMNTSQPGLIESALEHKGRFTYVGALHVQDTRELRPFYAAADGPQGPGHAGENAWKGGVLRLDFHPQTPHYLYSISSSFEQIANVVLRNDQVNLWNNLGPEGANAVVDRDYAVRDDEVAPLNHTIDLALATALLGRTYITLAVQPQSYAESQFEFSMKNHRNIADIGLFPANKYSARTYWSVQIVSAYESTGAKDHDSRHPPISETGSFGHAHSGVVENVPGTAKMKIGYMRETIADYRRDTPTHIAPPGAPAPVPLVLSPELERRVVAHELVHTFGLGHDSAIMCFHNLVQSGGTGSTLAPFHLQTMRLSKEPVNPTTNEDCQ